MSIITIDFFGTLDKYADFWKEMLGYVMLEGIKIYVISGVMPSELVGRLEELGYSERTHFTEAFSIFTHLSAKGEHIWYSEDHDSYRCSTETYWNSKAEMCKRLGSRIHIDDDVRFKYAFSKVATRFVYNRLDPGKSLIQKWHESLKLANTYTEWEDDYMSMYGFSPC